MTSIKVQKTEVSRNQNFRISVRLKNRSGGDVDEGRWSLVVPPEVAFVSTSLGTSLQLVGDRLILSPLVIYAQKSIKFTITMRVLLTASGRLVFHSFLNDPDIYCEKVASETVSLFIPLLVRPRPLSLTFLPLFHPILADRQRNPQEEEVCVGVLQKAPRLSIFARLS